MYLGVDNANDGASCLIDKNKRLIVCVSWKFVIRKKKKYFDVEIYSEGKKTSTTIKRCFRSLGILIYKVTKPYCFNGVTIGVEDTFFKSNMRTCITLTKNNTYVACMLEHLYKESVEWVMPSQWRGSLKLKKAKRAIAKQIALDYIPKEVSDLSNAMAILGELDHITDSAGIALYLINKENYGK